MSKQKHEEVPPEVIFKRKVKKYFRRTIKIGLLIVGYFWLLPLLVPSLSPQVERTKQGVVGAAKQAQTTITQVLGSASEFTQRGTSGDATEKSINPEAFIQETVNDLGDRVKALPREQLKKVKTQFCSDLIEETKLACESTPSSAGDE